MNQRDKFITGRAGERIVARRLGGKLTRHTAPFDVVDFNQGIAYEVKTMAGLSARYPIHITPASMQHKREFMIAYGIDTAYLVAVVIHNPNRTELYIGELKSHVRLSAMRKLN
ncbi:MAG: hypothetical protein IMZ61_10910 [Planctomycetes bacterium]|nr:hypothetical protein [Planctomycetota bacterium]